MSARPEADPGMSTPSPTPMAPPGASRRIAFGLRTYLSLMLATVSTVSFLVSGVVLFMYRVPQITQSTRAELQAEANDLALRTGLVLAGMQTQMELISSLLLSDAHGQDLQFVLSRAVDKNSPFSSIYQLDKNGTVVRAAVHPFMDDRRRRELLGNDYSRIPHVVSLRDSVIPLWSDKYVSSVSGTVTVALGARVGEGALIAEVPLDYILRSLQTAAGHGGSAVWLLDSKGEVLADSEDSTRVGVVNLGNEPLFREASVGGEAGGVMRFEGRDFDTAMSRAEALNWFVVTRLPAGLSSPPIVSKLELVFITTAGAMLLGLLVSPLLAMFLARPLATITQQARRIADGDAPGPWPEGWTVELNNLSHDLDRMARSLQARERELEAIFNASPIGIAVVNLGQNQRIAKVNDTILRQFGLAREAFVGHNSVDLGLWVDSRDRDQLFNAVGQGHEVEMEAWRLRVDGSRFLALHTARTFTDATGQDQFAVIVLRDVTELRRIEDEIRHLNADLERRVEQRTQELVQTNARLSTTLDSLQRTQDELVRSEKLASLGALVAGIAHELNTPLGNGVMAVSTMRAALASFQADSAQGLKRSSLDRLVAAMDMGSDIAQRNLQRAAELVASFKQVAADQTSAQRRRFDLHEVCEEIVLTLRPVLRQSDVQVEVRVPDGLSLDSYPGALGQVLTNLVTNAVTHAFEGRSEPCITITAEPVGEDRVAVRVADNGQGIGADLLPRIFDPFVTTRMGRGGTGLGLHIVHNLVFSTLGGTVAVKSRVGEGTEFLVEMPRVAPTNATPG